MLSAKYLASIEGEYACAEFEENFKPKKDLRKHMKHMKRIKLMKHIKLPLKIVWIFKMNIGYMAAHCEI